ncbi:hypothetical protein ACFLRI_04085 [Bacteroidota bacterium]
MSKSHDDQGANLSLEERNFNDYINRGDDFMKIQILRNAKQCYLKALEIYPDNQLAKDKLADCQVKLKSESRIIITIVSIAAVIILAVLLF